MSLTLRLSEADEIALEQLTSYEKVSRQEAIVRAIHEAVQTRIHNERVDKASVKARERYADVLERLSH